jgi:hypothetical protein
VNKKRESERERAGEHQATSVNGTREVATNAVSVERSSVVMVNFGEIQALAESAKVLKNVDVTNQLFDLDCSLRLDLSL